MALPFFVLKLNKVNFKMTPYAGLDHNFFELKKGKPDYENGAHWPYVVNDF